MKILITALGLIAGLSSIFYLNRQVMYTVTINRPIEVVWEYASDSSKATDWSIYFHHISPLAGVEDGKVGSLRRCYRRADESGATWDEEVIEVKPLEYRQLKTFNLQNFKNPVLKKAVFRVHQIYEKVDSKKTKLTFASEYIGPLELDIIQALLPAASETERIFMANLENIKAAIEQGDEYQRPHPYEQKNIFDKD